MEVPHAEKITYNCRWGSTAGVRSCADAQNALLTHGWYVGKEVWETGDSTARRWFLRGCLRNDGCPSRLSHDFVTMGDKMFRLM